MKLRRWAAAKTIEGTWGVGIVEWKDGDGFMSPAPMFASPQFTYKDEEVAQVMVDVLNKLRVDL